MLYWYQDDEDEEDFEPGEEEEEEEEDEEEEEEEDDSHEPDTKKRRIDWLNFFFTKVMHTVIITFKSGSFLRLLASTCVPHRFLMSHLTARTSAIKVCCCFIILSVNTTIHA